MMSNGQGPGELGGDKGVPRSGKTHVSTLENAVASYGVDPKSGALTQLDWFCTTDYDHLNGADRDIGSSGVALLDPQTFSGGGVKRIAVAAGKNGKVRNRAHLGIRSILLMGFQDIYIERR